jgi:hypothetical protein
MMACLWVTSKVDKHDRLKCSDACPSCGAEDERCHHVLTCPAEARDKWRTEFVEALRQKLADLKTDKPSGL